MRDLRIANRRRVLAALRREGAVSRTALAEATGLSFPTVDSILSELLARGVVEDGGAAESGTGRPPRLARLHADARHILAVDLSGGSAVAHLLDLGGNVRDSMPGPAVSRSTSVNVLEWIRRLVDAEESSRLVVAMAVPGVVSGRTGRVRIVPALGWEDVDLLALLDLPPLAGFVVENDVNAVTLGYLESLPKHRRDRTLLYVLLGSTGLGASIVIDGKLFRGAHRAAGELGLSVLGGWPPDGPLALGASGPFEAEVLALARRVREAEIGAAAADLRELARRIHNLIHNVACALDPDAIVLDWTTGSVDTLVGFIEDAWLGPFEPNIVAVSSGDMAALRGITRLAMSHVDRDLTQPSRAPNVRDLEAAQAAVSALARTDDQVEKGGRRGSA